MLFETTKGYNLNLANLPYIWPMVTYSNLSLSLRIWEHISHWGIRALSICRDEYCKSPPNLLQRSETTVMMVVAFSKLIEYHIGWIGVVVVLSWFNFLTVRRTLTYFMGAAILKLKLIFFFSKDVFKICSRELLDGNSFHFKVAC